MKYIFVAGVPGSKWSSVVKNIYYSASIDQSDHTGQRTYAHPGAYNGATMHLGSYFDPGMEFGTWFDCLDQFSKHQCEQEFDRPFSGQGVRIIKSHMFTYHVDFLKRTWPDCAVIMVYRDNAASLDWWVRCGGFSIAYPNYVAHYRDIDFMTQEICQQNKAMMLNWDRGQTVHNNVELCSALGIHPPPSEYQQIYTDQDVKVRVY
jgi:hypothetical protein